jgi:hypothetical protein
VVECRTFIAPKSRMLKPVCHESRKKDRGSLSGPGNRRDALSLGGLSGHLIIARRWLSSCTILLQYSWRAVPGRAAWPRRECAPVISCSCCCNSCIRRCSSSVFCRGVSISSPSVMQLQLNRAAWTGATYATGVIKPQISHMCTRNGSLTSNNLSFKKLLAPCAIMQSRSISPKRRPPSLARPSTGCLVSI